MAEISSIRTFARCSFFVGSWFSLPLEVVPSPLVMCSHFPLCSPASSQHSSIFSVCLQLLLPLGGQLCSQHLTLASHLGGPRLRMNAFPMCSFGKQRDKCLMMIPGWSPVGIFHFLKGGRRVCHSCLKSLSSNITDIADRSVQPKAEVQTVLPATWLWVPGD